MKRLWRSLSSLMLGALVALLITAFWPEGTGGQGMAIAAPLPISKRPPIEVNVELGTVEGELKFTPAEFNFEAGKRYRLHLKNESPMKHYFTAKDFADAIWSQKVDAGNVEIKGAIHDLELRPNTEADWVFIPARAGSYSLKCTVAGHAEAGMVGKIEIEG